MSEQTEPETEIAVAGAGPAGLIAALALARAGFSVALAGPRANGSDRRTTALMVPALAELRTLGVLGRIEAQAAPLRAMRIIDATDRLVRSPTVTFHASEIDEAHFGLNIPNQVLNSALEEAVAAEPAIRRLLAPVSGWAIDADQARATLEDGTVIAARLAVAADGRNSPTREAAGIRTLSRAYRQAALVLAFGHEKSHGFISTEFHTSGGPFTQVPLPGNRSSLVWVMEPAAAERMAGQDPEMLSREVETRMGSMLGKVEVEPGVQVYKLSAGIPVRFGRNRVALVGEAAHVFPPIGAQGLNLGIRDVAQLVGIVGRNPTDPGSPATLAAYDAVRRPDILARTGAVSLLNRSLLSDFLPAQVVRSAGLAALGAFGPLRGFFMREGLAPGSGLRALASTVRERIRR
jgi:2-octaprenyl-6-methoxyphenol hydroxylase